MHDEHEIERAAEREDQLENSICIHIFSASATLVGACLTVIGLFRVIAQLKDVRFVIDDIIAVNAVLFMSACFLAYFALRARNRARRRRIERVADSVFLLALGMMVAVCAFVAYEIM